jgi:hypothetical protein
MSSAVFCGIDHVRYGKGIGEGAVAGEEPSFHKGEFDSPHVIDLKIWR